MNEREKIIVLKQILFFNFELTDDPSIGNFRLTPEQGLQIVQLYYENLRSLKNVFRALCSTYGQHNGLLSVHSIHYWIIFDRIDHVQHPVNNI